MRIDTGLLRAQPALGFVPFEPAGNIQHLRNVVPGTAKPPGRPRFLAAGSRGPHNDARRFQAIQEDVPCPPRRN
jgi:hypothetical protein